MIESTVISSPSRDLDLFQDFRNEYLFHPENDHVNYFQNDFKPSDDIVTTNLSCSSSDYEDLNLDDSGLMPFADSFISQFLEENSLDFGDSDWSSLLDSESRNFPAEHSEPVQSSDKVKKAHRCQSAKSWSKMSTEEQINTLHILSEIVTRHMSISEQIEIIKIIDPTITISPDDTEFALDSSFLDDSKMKRIRSLVQKHGFSLNYPNSSSVKRSTSNKSFSSKISSRTKRRQKKQKMLADESNIHKRKLELHGQKEAESGLFVYEKVIKLINPLEEDEDVNILE